MTITGIHLAVFRRADNTDYAGQLRPTVLGPGVNQMRLFDTWRTTTYAHCQL